MFAVNWKEDSSCEVLGRVTARNGSGAATGVSGEGKFLQQADVSSITAKVYNITDDPSGESPVLEATLTVSTVILNTVDDSGEVWTQDDIGYNFRHSIASTVFTDGGDIYRVEYKFTLTGGEVFHEVFEGPANSILQS
jgi:hypothetical protein